MAKAKHPFVGLEIQELPFHPNADNSVYYPDSTVDSVRVFNTGVTEDGKTWEFGEMVIDECDGTGFYACDGKIIVLDGAPGDFFGIDLFGDVLILVGHDGAKYHNVKTLEQGEITV